LQLRTLPGNNYEELLNAFNLAFSDYFIPVSVGIEQFTTKLESHNIDLSLSVGAYEDNKLVGFILHGVTPYINNRIIYNLGTGVIPSARGEKLTSKMYEHILPDLIESGCEQVQLEVVTKNAAAIKSYLNSGFSISRELSCYKGIITKGSVNQEYIYKNIEKIHWDKLMSFWDTNPTIQNSPELVKNRFNELTIIGAYSNRELIGYVIYNPKEKSVMQLAVDAKYRNRGVATSLLRNLNEANSITILNIDKQQEAINQFIKRIGMAVFIEQYELTLPLN